VAAKVDRPSDIAAAGESNCQSIGCRRTMGGDHSSRPDADVMMSIL